MAITADSYFKRSTIFGEREISSYQTDDFGSIPQIVYKYLNLSSTFHRDSLINDYMRFSDPTTFNDPFDCKTSFAYHLLADNEQYCRSYYECQSNIVEPLLSDLDRKFVVDQNVNRILSNKSNIDFFRNLERESLEHTIEGIKQFGVFCTCMINDNILLWSHYAGNHKGICLGLKVDKMLETYYVNGQMGSGEVKYDVFPLILPPLPDDESAITNTFQPLFLTKAPFWNYELEYRFLDYPCTERKKLMGNILDTIYMGCDISLEDENFIIELCRNRNPKVRLYKAQKAFYKYEIEFIKIVY